MANLIQRFNRARHSYWRVEDPTTLGALFCLLQANVRVLPVAWKALSYEYKGTPPFRLTEWADAIDDAYLAGF